MGSREDDEYWNDKYSGEWFVGASAEAECHKHPDSDMYYDEDEAEWLCDDCQSEKVEQADNERTYHYG